MTLSHSESKYTSESRYDWRGHGDASKGLWYIVSVCLVRDKKKKMAFVVHKWGRWKSEKSQQTRNGGNNCIAASDSELERLWCIIHFRGRAVVRQESEGVKMSCNVTCKLEKSSEWVNQLHVLTPSRHKRCKCSSAKLWTHRNGTSVLSPTFVVETAVTMECFWKTVIGVRATFKTEGAPSAG